MARHQPRIVQIGPDMWQVFLFHAQEVDTLPARDLDGRNGIFVRRIGNRAQFARVGHAAPHARDYGVSTVLLDIRVVALVHEPALRVVGVIQRPVGQEIEVQRRTAGGAATKCLPSQFLHDRRHGFQRARLDQAAHILMRQIRATAHRLHRGLFKRLAQGAGQHLFHQPRTCSARGAGLGRCANIGQTGGTSVDRIQDRSLADAVAATDLRIKRQGCNGCQRVRLATPLKGRAKYQRIAEGRNIRAVLDQAKEPRSICRISIHDRADQPVLFDDQPFVDPACWVAENDILAPWCICKIARAEQIDACDFQLGGGLHRLERGRLSGQRGGDNLGLIVKRGHQSEQLAVMFHTFADRQNVRVGCDHLVVDDDPARNLQPRIRGKTRFRADTDCHAHLIGVINRAIFKQDRLDVGIAQNGFGRAFAMDTDAARLKILLQQIARCGIKLPFHQMAHQVNDSHVHSARLEACRCFQPQKTAADHHRFCAGIGRGVDHRLRIIHVAIGYNAGQILALNGDDERCRSRGDQQLVIGCGARAGVDCLGFAVDPHHRFAEAARDPVLRIKIVVMRDNVLV